MTKSVLIAGCLLMFVPPSVSVAQSSFNGTWKFDFDSAMPRRVNVWLLSGGMYRCASCKPSVDVKADGHDQRVSGQSYDTISVRIVDHRTVEEVEKKNGRIVSDETFTLSSDGNTVADEFGNWKVTMARIAKAPVDSHALSGSWQPLKVEVITDRELLVTYKLDGGALSMNRPTGQSYTARLNGADAPFKGAPDRNSVSLRRLAINTIEETDKLDGKPVSVARMAVSADGKSMTVSVKDLRGGATNEFTMQKQ